MDLNLSEFGHRVRTYRTAKNISREALAEAAGCSKRHLDNIENGKVNATVNIIYLIAAALGVSSSRLIGDEKVEYHFQEMTDEELIACYKSASEMDKARFKALAQVVFAQKISDIPIIIHR